MGKFKGLWLILTFMAASSQAQAGTPYTPKAGSADRAAIMTAIRAGLSSDTVFVVDFLKVADMPDFGLAYAEVHPSPDREQGGFEGWAFLRKSGSQWHLDSAVGSDGANDCADLVDIYRHPLETAKLARISPDLFSEGFQTDYEDAIEGAKEGVSCVGDIADVSH